jgi:tetratricopeptide (TPR) repeat protein
MNRPAANAARRALNRHGTDAQLYLLLARAEKADRRLPEAAEALEMAVQIEARMKHAWPLLGTVRALQHRHKEAITAFQKAIELQNDNADAYVGLGRSLLALGEGGDAVTTLARGLVFAPQARALRYALGRVLLLEGKFKSALPHLESFVDGQPNHWKGLFTLGLAYAQSGRQTLAKPLFDRALNLKPKNAVIHFNSAMTLMAMGNDAAAAVALESAVQLQYSLWQAHCERARVLHRLQRYDDAGASYAQAVKLNPELVVAKAALASGPKSAMAHMIAGLACSPNRYLDIRN